MGRCRHGTNGDDESAAGVFYRGIRYLASLVLTTKQERTRFKKTPKWLFVAAFRLLYKLPPVNLKRKGIESPVTFATRDHRLDHEHRKPF